MKQLLQNIRQWGIDRNIIGSNGKSNPLKQHEKTQEEVDELLDAIKTLNRPEVADAIGDIVVTLVLQADMWGLDFEECVQGAYSTIANRTGKIVDGIFIKDDDTEAQKQRRAENAAKRQDDNDLNEPLGQACVLGDTDCESCS